MIKCHCSNHFAHDCCFLIMKKRFDKEIMFNVAEKECEADNQRSAHHPTGKTL